MGRYYTGDIEGKFWFGVQSSDDASFFGGQEMTPNHIDYYFEEDDIEQIEKGIALCMKNLTGYKKKLDKFFKRENGYNDEMLMEELEVNRDKVKKLLEWYARLLLGQKILERVKEHKYCEFMAEL